MVSFAFSRLAATGRRWVGRLLLVSLVATTCVGVAVAGNPPRDAGAQGPDASARQADRLAGRALRMEKMRRSSGAIRPAHPRESQRSAAPPKQGGPIPILPH
jgi:hypothetical protein